MSINITLFCSYSCEKLDDIFKGDVFFWKTTVSTDCCLHCDSQTVYKANTIIHQNVANDECQTIKTSVCRNSPTNGKAKIEVEFSFKGCCIDESGRTDINNMFIYGKL